MSIFKKNVIILIVLLAAQNISAQTTPTVYGAGTYFGGFNSVVMISGQNLFQSNYSVSVNIAGLPEQFLFASSNNLSFIISSPASGPIMITYTPTAGGTPIVVYAGTFVFDPPIQITNFSPNSGTTGTTVTINGQNLTQAGYTLSSVTIGGTAATIVSNTSNVITVTVGAGASGTIYLYYTPYSSGNTQGYPVGNFTYNAPVATTVKSFSPDSASSGKTVSIYGQGFTGATAVSFGGVAAASFTVIGDTAIIAVIATGASGNISVTSPQGTATDTGFTFILPPAITSFTPHSATTGTTVTITGTNFTGTTAVSLGNKPAASFTVVNATTITAVVQSGISDSVIVTTPAGRATANGFSFTAPPAPILASFTPTAAASGATVTITGANFTGATAVSFGSTPVASFTVVSATTITATVPAGSLGPDSIAVTTPGGRAAIAGFTLLPPPPTITSFTPATGTTGTTITIYGTNFSGATAVTLGGASAASFTIMYPTEIVAVVQSGSSDTIAVTTPGGTAIGTGFTFVTPPAPTITSFTPAGAQSGVTVTITGTNFTGLTAVHFGDSAASSYTLVNATTITAVTGKGASGNISVTTPGGTAADSGFTFIAPPVISSFTPLVACPGTPVTIEGAHFTNTTVVSFGGTNATSFTVNSDTSITAIANGSTGVVKVITAMGTTTSSGTITTWTNPLLDITLNNTGTCLTVVPLSVSGASDASGVLWYHGDSLVHTSSRIPVANGTIVAGGNGAGGGATQLNYPGSVFIDSSGYIYVADDGNYRVQKFPPGSTASTKGTTVAGGNGPGETTKQLYFPSGVYVDHADNIFVADEFNNRILKFPPGSDSSTNGVIVAGGNGTGSDPNQFNTLVGVFVDDSGYIYAVDQLNNRIQKFPPNSTSSTYGTTVAGGNGTGSTAKQLSNPNGVYVDGNGNLYVADQSNNRVQKFPWGSTSSTNGVTVAGGNGAGSAANQLNFPSAVYLDIAGNMYVSDDDNNRIQEFPAGSTANTYGTTVAGGNGRGSAANQLYAPLGIYVDSSGNVYIAGNGSNSVQKWAAATPPDTTYTPTGTGSYTVAVTNAAGCSVTAATIVGGGGTVYTFTGSGNWSLPANWSNNTVPPSVLPPCSQIMINPADSNAECVLDMPQTISSGAMLIIATGKKVRIPGNLIIQ